MDKPTNLLTVRASRTDRQILSGPHDVPRVRHQAALVEQDDFRRDDFGARCHAGCGTRLAELPDVWVHAERAWCSEECIAWDALADDEESRLCAAEDARDALGAA